jgi:YjbE family integral membrane protein
MTDWFAPDFWLQVGQILMINIVLSGDNAVVIALACRNLPPKQRRIAVFGGVLGAVGARVVLTAFAVSLLQLPWLKLIGAVLLVWIGVKLIAADSESDRDIKADERLWSAIYTVVMADVIMSLDNVIGVAAAARGNVSLLVLGLAISIPIVVFGSGIVMKLLTRFPILIAAGGGLLGYVAGDMAATDPVVASFVFGREWIEVFAPVAGFVGVIAAGMGLRKRDLR